MFTGIVRSIGRVRALEYNSGDARLTISGESMGFEDTVLGDSIACNGACLTVIDKDMDSFLVDVSVETLSLTTIGTWKVGQRINLEKAMLATDRFGGHIVSGHIDGLGEVTGRKKDARSEWLEISAPPDLAKYIAQKGSITVDGISLTVNRVKGPDFELNVIPQTLNHTVIEDYEIGTKVNLEVDLIARYLERLLAGTKSDDSLS